MGCSKFLTLIPLNDVVFENFWTDKADVESVLLGVYSSLESSNCIVRMSMWGEMRSDNIVAGNNPSDDLLQITKENLLETNSLMTWSCFYDVINRANTVIKFAPGVAEKDPNYTDAELNGNLAEAYTLRSLCYFYLIRAYRDVPYVSRPSAEDTEEFVVPASKFDAVLDSLIETMELWADKAVNKYTMEQANTGRITRVAAYALLADMYLWKGEWQKCIDYCEKVLARKIIDYKELKEKEGSDCLVVYDPATNPIPLYKETTGSNVAGTAYNQIFGRGFSFESLFELAFMDNQSVSNSFVSSYYGGRNSSGSLSAYSRLFIDASSTNGNQYFKPFDCRYLESMADGSSTYPIRKYVAYNTSFDLVSATTTAPTATIQYRNDNQNANWIIYRLSDVMLMEAEAKVQLANELGGGAVAAPEVTALLREAFDIVSAIYNRAINYPTNARALPLSFADYSGSIKSMEELVLLERRRELLFEGKRWFDLVRMCRRDGTTRRLVSSVIPKFTENQSAIRIKLADMDAIYFPIAKSELKINPLLKQNPAFVEDEYTAKSSD